MLFAMRSDTDARVTSTTILWVVSGFENFWFLLSTSCWDIFFRSARYKFESVLCSLTLKNVSQDSPLSCTISSSVVWLKSTMRRVKACIVHGASHVMWQQDLSVSSSQHLFMSCASLLSTFPHRSSSENLATCLDALLLSTIPHLKICHLSWCIIIYYQLGVCCQVARRVREPCVRWDASWETPECRVGFRGVAWSLTQRIRVSLVRGLQSQVKIEQSSSRLTRMNTVNLIHTNAHSHAHTHTHTYIHTNKQEHTNTHTHTHTHTVQYCNVGSGGLKRQYFIVTLWINDKKIKIGAQVQQGYYVLNWQTRVDWKIWLKGWKKVLAK